MSEHSEDELLKATSIHPRGQTNQPYSQSSNHSPGHTRSHSAGNIPITSDIQIQNESYKPPVKFDHLNILIEPQSPNTVDSLRSDYAGSLAFRPFMSFSRLVSGHTLGEEDEPTSISSEPDTAAKIPQPRRRLRNNFVTSHSCHTSPRDIQDKPQSSSLKVDRTQSDIRTRANSGSALDMKNMVHSKKSKHTRTNSKEIDHWLEYKKKYSAPTKQHNDDLEMNSLKDITNVKKASELVCFDKSQFSENNPGHTHSNMSRSMPDPKTVGVISGNSHVTGINNWSANMSAIQKRKQELEDEIRMLEEGKTPISTSQSVDSTNNHRYISSIPTIALNGHKQDISPRTHFEPDSDSSDAHKSSFRKSDTSPFRNSDRNLREEVTKNVSPNNSPSAGSQHCRRSVLGKPPAHPKRGPIVSLRNVGDDYFPRPVRKPSESKSTEHGISRSMRRFESVNLATEDAVFDDNHTTSSLGSAENSVQALLESVRAGNRKRQGRRALSDLGFDSPPSVPKLSPSRTSALLNNPAMRKHLARSMGLSHSASEEEIKEVIDEKLDSVINGNGRMERRSSSTVSLCSHGYKEINGLYKTPSLSDGLDQSRDQDFSSERLSHDSTKDEQKVNTENGNANEIETNEPVEMRQKFNQSTKQSKFQIPSFSEFRKQKHGAKRRPVSTSFEFFIEAPIKEESESNDLQSDPEGQKLSSGSGSKPSTQIKSDKVLERLKQFTNESTSPESSLNSSKSLCDCTLSCDTAEYGFRDENQNVERCSKCEKLRTNSGQIDTLQNKQKSPRSILKSNSELETVLLECSPRQSDEEKLNKHNRKWRKKIQEAEGVVNRSVSDVSDIAAEEDRRKASKDRRHKLYKSDPLGKAKGDSKDGGEGAEIENELLSLIQEVQSGSAQSLESTHTQSSIQSIDSCLGETSSDERPIPPPRTKKNRSRKKKKRRSKENTVKCDIDRTDSGVGKETLSPNATERDLQCADCETSLSIVDALDSDVKLCQRCIQHREERKRTILEIVDTEENYGKDLNILFDEFYVPMKCNGLLTQEQLETIFLNLEELISLNKHFQLKLHSLVEIAREKGEEDLATVRIGELFLETSNMLLAFETYCIDQAEATSLLEQLEKERELLKIFLEVSQAENNALRRMHLKAFLVIPVQRIMKYPLLLSRVYKKTPDRHEDKKKIKEARIKIEEILEHINGKAKGSMRVRKKFFVQQLLRRQSDGLNEDLEIHKIAIETLGWSKHDTHIAYSGKLQYSTMPDLNLTKRGKVVKFITVQAVLVTQGKQGRSYDSERSHLWFPKHNGLSQAALVLLKEKASKYSSQREPFFLDKCIVSMDSDFPEVFEINEMNSTHDCYIFKSEEHKETAIWYNHLKFQTKDLGKWRQRRNALPNIMITLGK